MAPLWSSADWGSCTENDACRNLRGRYRWTVFTTSIVGPESLWRWRVHCTSGYIWRCFFLYKCYICIYQSFGLVLNMLLQSWTILNLRNHPKSSHMPITGSTTAATDSWKSEGHGLVSWGWLKISATFQSFPFDLQSDKQHGVAPMCNFISLFPRYGFLLDAHGSKSGF